MTARPPHAALAPMRRLPRSPHECSSAVRPNRRRCRIGLSLLEVILALTILGLTLAVLGELVRLGARAARNASDMTRAQLLCESMMSEVAAQESGPVAVGETDFLDDPEWSYAVDVQPIDRPGLVLVTVTVQKSTRDTLSLQSNIHYQLVRWMIDPNVQPAPDSVLGL